MEKTSVIVASYNGAKKLPNLLKKLTIQTEQNFELIVVLDGSKDNSEIILEEYKSKFQNLSIYKKENGGRANARNFGAKKANGTLLIFYDDDLLPVPNSIELHVKHHQNYEKSIYQGDCSVDIRSCRTDFQKYNSYLCEKWVKNLPSYPDPLPNSMAYLSAANCSISKKSLFDLGGFNELLTDCEDFDFCAKAKEKFMLIFYDNNNKAWHNDLLSMEKFIERQKEYQKSYMKLIREYPERYIKEINNFHKVNFFKKTIYAIFSNNLWIVVIDQFNFLKILPKPIKYYLYGIIITANLN